jgi:hypothetical protein
MGRDEPISKAYIFENSMAGERGRDEMEEVEKGAFREESMKKRGCRAAFWVPPGLPQKRNTTDGRF